MSLILCAVVMMGDSCFMYKYRIVSVMSNEFKEHDSYDVLF
jgi:hypothetical protein